MKLKTLLLIAPMFFVAGCASSLTGDSYNRYDARQVQNISYGNIVELKLVKIEGTKSPIGAIAGAALGGVAGNTIGGGSGRTLMTIIGAVGGGLLGNQGEELLTRSNGVEIVVKLDDGNTKGFVQEVNPNEQFNVGDRVRLSTVNGKTRVVKSYNN